MIRIVSPKPDEVKRLGGEETLCVLADTEDEIKALGEVVDDGKQRFSAAVGSTALASVDDKSIVYTRFPSGWKKTGG